MNKLHILIVDDDPDFAETLSDVLAIPGHQAETALSGEEAVQKFRKQEYDFAFLDVKMPGKNGVETFFEIRESRPNAKVALITGHSVEQLLDETVNGGAWSVLQPPFTKQHVVDLLGHISPEGILLVEDNPDVVRKITDVMHQADRRVFITHDREEALAATREGAFDVLILDLRIPVLCALEVFRGLKALGLAKPAVIVTCFAAKLSGAEPMDLSSFWSTGVLSKSIDPKSLLEIVERLAPVCVGHVDDD